MSASYIEPLDIKTIFINYFLGNQVLFPFAFVILISAICGYFQMSNKVFLIILVIGSVMFGQYLGEVYYMLVLFIVGFLIYKTFSSVFR